MNRWIVLILAACTTGKEPVCSEVSDCDDPACADAAVCAEPDTDVEPEETPEPETGDTDVEPDPMDQGWDGSGSRPPGPHPQERDMATAWQVLEETITTDYGSSCGRQDALLDQLTAGPPRPISATPQDAFFHVFLHISPTELTAQSMACEDGEYPDNCDVGDEEFIIDPATHTLLATTVETVTPPNAGCEVTRTILHRITDDGRTGIEEISTELDLTACSGEILRNHECIVTHTYDLAFDVVRPLN